MLSSLKGGILADGEGRVCIPCLGDCISFVSSEESSI
jgi:hypothetical protein